MAYEPNERWTVGTDQQTGENCKKGVSMRISAAKSNVMHIGGDQDVTSISFDEHNIKEIDSFTYCGSLIASNSDVEVDISYRIGKLVQFSRKCTEYGLQRWLPMWRSSCIMLSTYPLWPMLVKHGRTQPVLVINLMSSINDAYTEYFVSLASPCHQWWNSV